MHELLNNSKNYLDEIIIEKKIANPSFPALLLLLGQNTQALLGYHNGYYFIPSFFSNPFVGG